MPDNELNVLIHWDPFCVNIAAVSGCKVSWSNITRGCRFHAHHWRRRQLLDTRKSESTGPVHSCYKV